MPKEYEENAAGLEDILNYATFATQEADIVQLKDGALLAGYYFTGPDLDLADPSLLERHSAQFNTAALHCGTGWMMHVDLFHLETVEYLPPGEFTDPTSALIDEERRRQYEQPGAHYKSIQTLGITYLPPHPVLQTFDTFFTSGPKEWDRQDQHTLATFRFVLQQIEESLHGVLQFSRIAGEEDFLTYLHTAVTGNSRLVAKPAVTTFLDETIADVALVPGIKPLLGNEHVRVVGVEGYPLMTMPGAQMFLHDLQLPYRWSTRFIFLDREDAEQLIKEKQKYWQQKVTPFGGKVQRFAGDASEARDKQEPLRMLLDAEEAEVEAASGQVLFGLHTMTVAVQHKDEAKADTMAQFVRKWLAQCGYEGRIEEENAVDALIGSWPGHGYQNSRRAPIHTENLADLLPLTSLWAGQPEMPAGSYFPAGTPGLMVASTHGGSPFFATPWVNEVGHTAILGATRTGKSALLSTLFAQFLRFGSRARCFVFDKDYSAYPLCIAVGGNHHDIGAESTPLFAPYALVDDEQERGWALEWTVELYRLQNREINPEERGALWAALCRMGKRNHSRTISGLWADVQDVSLRQGLEYYMEEGGSGGLLDAETDGLTEGRFQVFEMGRLLNRPQDLIPTQLYLLHWIERRCQEGWPTVLAVDEFQQMMQSSLFAGAFDKWLRTMARKFVSVWLATQSLEEIAKSDFRSVITDSCRTMIFTPNAAALAAHNQELYRAFGLNPQEIHAIRDGKEKCDYLWKQGDKSRVIQAQLGRATLAFCGVPDVDLWRVRELIAEHGPNYPPHWLRERHCEQEAIWWQRWKQTNGKIQEEEQHDALWADMHTGNGHEHVQ
jgi:type IV secretion system protein VirB4